MAETLLKAEEGTDREGQYQVLLPQIDQLMQEESDLIANLANVCAALNETFGFLWVGFYIVKDEQLVLGPFQGPLACTRIAFGKGVCGAAWKEKKTMLVPDVELFPGHIACSSLSRSEVVVPVIVEDEVKMVLDVDSEQLNDFSDVDVKWLENLCSIISNLALQRGWFH
jgi:L-methionine (R)-S-oxide reductase